HRRRRETASIAPLTRSRLKRHSSVRCRFRSPYVHHLHWWVRLPAWALAGLPLWLLEPRIAPLGPALFETLLVLTGIRAHRRWRRRGRPSGPPGSPDGFDLEPRWPRPPAGAGTIRLPEPL